MNGKFYLGRIYDPAQGGVTGQPLLYDPADLTTHAVVVGMTGSGKTGLCLDLLEEAALNGIPALMIDPKGDIANTLLHFPDLAPQDFQPWVNLDQARREGKTSEQAAVEAASRWRQELAGWDIPIEQVKALKNAAQFAIFTPGSDAGIPVSILASLKAPAIPWEGNRELLREKISGTVTAILGLVGLADIDPVRSREHILLSNIFEQAWSQGSDLDLGELILQTQTPPFARLGVFDVNTFFPEKERFELAMLLNNILAAPAFQAWMEGEPLDIQNLLYTRDGRPRHSIFYIAHLNDAERMFFVTLLFSAVETWMRSQPGTASLRSIVYFDEIFGYLPPTANPPSKQPILRMLKTARAFGVGLLLVTQNPVDLDYKALANAGTWFIGKLQTDQDKRRLLDGLEGATTGGLDRGAYDRMISALGKRIFLLHNVHASAPQLFQSRQAINYLAGPVTRIQIPLLNQLNGAMLPPSAPAASVPPASTPGPLTDLSEFQPIPVVTSSPQASPAPRAATPASPEAIPPAAPGSATRPALPAGVREYFLPNNLTFTQAFQAAGRPYPEQAYSVGLVYRPVILAQAGIRFFNRKYNLDDELRRSAIVTEPDRRGAIRWEDALVPEVYPKDLDGPPDPQARYATLEAPFSEARTLAAIGKDFADWVYRTSQVTVRANESLKLYAGPQCSKAEFLTTCAETAREGRDAEIKKAAGAYDKKIAVLQEKLTREERELEQDRTELSERKMEQLGTDVENIFGLFGGRRSGRRLSTSLTKRRLTERAKADVNESKETVRDLKGQIEALEKEKAGVIQEISQRWSQVAMDVTEINVPAPRKDVLVELFGVAWFPYYLINIENQLIEIPGYGSS